METSRRLRWRWGINRWIVLGLMIFTVIAVNVIAAPVQPTISVAAEKIIEEHQINQFERLVERVEKEKIDAVINESKQETPAAPEPLAEPIAPECTIDDFMKVDLRIATVVTAQKVEGADKLLQLQLDIGGVRKNVFAGIAKAYEPEKLVGRKVVCVANLKPRKMKFGTSEGMILAAGEGNGDISMLSVDEGAKPGQRVH